MERNKPRPLRTVEVLDAAVRAVVQRPAAAVLRAAYAVVPMTVVGSLVAGALPVDVDLGGVDVPLRAAALVGTALVSYQLALGSGLELAISNHIGVRIVAGRRRWRTVWMALVVSCGIGLGAAAGIGAAALLHIVGMGEVSWLGTAVGSVLAASVWISWAVAVPVERVEGVGVGRSLERSHGLVRGRRVESFTVLLAAGLAAFAVHVLADVVASGAGASVGRIVAAGVVAVLLAPVYTSVVSVLYVDLRVRSDGFELLRDPSSDIVDPWDPWAAPRRRVVPEPRTYDHRGPSWER